MPLFQADVQLTRARLFRDRAALAEARRLIEKHGYYRRDGELTDAEEAARGWKKTKPIKANESLRPLRASAFEETALRQYQAVSAPDKPLVQMSKAARDEAWVRICKEIKKAVNP